MKNEKREATSVPNPIRDLFQHTKFVLGEHHFQEGKMEPCGPNCPHREKTISCPYFKPTVPCLVGCTIQYTQGVADEGLDYEQNDIFVIAQAGQYLIGFENIINMDSPRINRLRLLTDKYGNQISSPAAQEGITLFEGMQEGEILSEVHELEGVIGKQDDSSEEEHKPASS